MNALTELLNDVLLLGGGVLLLMSLATGLLFLLAPNRATSLEGRADQRWSLRKALRPLEIPRQTERFFYRHHRLAGALIVLLAAGFLWLYLVEGEGGRIAAWASRQVGTDLVGAWASNLGGFLVAVNFLALLFGTVMFVRPSSLKGIESMANRWISTRRATRPLESEYDPLGRFAGKYPRMFGAMVLLGTLFILVNLVFVLQRS